MSHWGTVYKWMSGKNYGFIREHGNDDDVFVHASTIMNGVPLGGDEVSFDMEFDATRDKPRAMNVTLLNQHGGGFGGNGGGRNERHGHGGYNNRHGGGHGGYNNHSNHHHNNHNHHNHHDGVSPRDEEAMLIEFGELLREGNDEAKALHAKYGTGDDLTAFKEAATAMILAKRGKSGGHASSGGGGGGGHSHKQQSTGNPSNTNTNTASTKPHKKTEKVEEKLLIVFGEKLGEGNDQAKAIHAKYTEDSDYAAFLKGVEELCSPAVSS